MSTQDGVKHLRFTSFSDASFTWVLDLQVQGIQAGATYPTMRMSSPNSEDQLLDLSYNFYGCNRIAGEVEFAESPADRMIFTFSVQCDIYSEIDLAGTWDVTIGQRQP